MIDLNDMMDKYTTRIEDTTFSTHAVAYQLLCSTARQHNTLYAELQALKELIGFNKPFPFLRLPRELRNEIYTHALRAAQQVYVIPLIMCIPSATENPYRPPTPGLLLTNRQVYGEAVEVLYSVNVLRFNDPGQLFAFEQRVGRENCAHVNKISIWVRIPRWDENVADPAVLPRDEYDSVPAHWIAALDTCGLCSVRQLGVEAEAIGGQPTSLLTMPAELKECIGRFLTRAEGSGVPRLMLTGFREEVEDEFPRDWEAVVDQWDDYKEEMEGYRQEMEEYEEYLRENGGAQDEYVDSEEESVE